MLDEEEKKIKNRYMLRELQENIEKEGNRSNSLWYDKR